MAAPSDATVYSGIRYSANTIENLALQAYWKKRADWPKIQKCLEDASKCLYKLVKVSVDGDDCPWTECEDGSCAPICEKNP